jgi:hypothetical protein
MIQQTPPPYVIVRSSIMDIGIYNLLGKECILPSTASDCSAHQPLGVPLDSSVPPLLVGLIQLLHCPLRKLLL